MATSRLDPEMMRQVMRYQAIRRELDRELEQQQRESDEQEASVLAQNAAALLAGWKGGNVTLEEWRQSWVLIKQMGSLDRERAMKAASLWGSMFGEWCMVNPASAYSRG